MTATTDPNKTRNGRTPTYTWAQLFARTDMRDGDEAIVTDIPAGGRRSRWYYDATAGRWRVFAPTLLVESTAVIDGLQQTAAQYLGGLTVAAGLLKGAVFSIRTGLGKSGTTDAYAVTNWRIGTGVSADASVGSINAVLSAANRSIGLEFFFRMASATSVEKLGSANGASFVGGGFAAAPNGAVVIPDVTGNANVIGVSTTMGGSTDKPQLTYQSVVIHP